MLAALLATTAGRAVLGALAGAALITGVVVYARHDAYQQAVADTKVAAAKDALIRVSTMEHNNVAFKNMSLLQRCLAYMRDSGLPASACD